MPRNTKTLIIIPAWNESASVGKVIEKILQLPHEYDVLVVNDGSSDNTEEVSLNAGANVATLPFNLGVGGAMRTGFVYAVENNYEAAVQVDADGQHDPVNIPELLSALEFSDIVIGARFAGKGDYQVSGPRKWVMQILAANISRIAGSKLTDTTSGFKALGPRAIKLFSKNYPAEYLGDTIEALVVAAQSGLKISQIPVSMHARQAGVASANPVKSAIYLFRALVALLFAMSRKPHPIVDASGGDQR
ncbi:glycosyltransferase family 2 protein [Aurantimicrobium sp. MWH-Uga1]|uniref:glycosyltransferase family 2 protein n=1 Tax=Aurantimicrobium sp. MWH-Uga1 TaxID=2079575 RepID=UPI000DEDE4CC|nr:glycosyltransferase family 2 protein [Aurantimicrobium sp. MWH-Uga1]AXE54904.1 Undecaprenyl-phosphate mannosyltransferase [Aurantimicrobium sp. MWH-Uga1]